MIFQIMIRLFIMPNTAHTIGHLIFLIGSMQLIINSGHLHLQYEKTYKNIKQTDKHLRQMQV